MVPAHMLATTLGNAVSSIFESPGTSSKEVAICAARCSARRCTTSGCAARGRTAPAGSRRPPAT